MRPVATGDPIAINALRAGFVRRGLLPRTEAYRLNGDEVESVRTGLRKNWPRRPPPRRHQRALRSWRTMCGRFAKDVVVGTEKRRPNCRRCHDAQVSNWARAAKRIFEIDEQTFIAAGLTRRRGLRP